MVRWDQGNLLGEIKLGGGAYTEKKVPTEKPQERYNLEKVTRHWHTCGTLLFSM